MKKILKTPLQIKKEHYRKVLFLACCTFAAMHFFHPDLEGTTAMMCNFLFYYDPIIAV